MSLIANDADAIEKNANESSTSHESFMQLSIPQLISKLVNVGIFRDIDEQFGLMLARLELQTTENSHFSMLLASMVSHQLGQGHVCLNLIDLERNPARLVGLFGVEAKIFNSKLFGVNWKEVAIGASFVGQRGEKQPIIIDQDKLYLHRYHSYETMLAEQLKSFGSPVSLLPTAVQKLSNELDELFKPELKYLFNALNKLKSESKSSQVKRQQTICESLDIVDDAQIDWDRVDNLVETATDLNAFNELHDLVPDSACLNWQKVAAAQALTRQFTVISGGPGTGKTTTVAKLLAAILLQSTTNNSAKNASIPTIKLVAPTGKAAARLTESIGNAIDELPVSPEIKSLMPSASSTIHRLLGVIPNRAEFRHNRSNPLHLDILIIDEASMVDLSMMYKVFQALPNHARVILLGDKDQLASVEAGAVLGEICNFHQVQYSPEQVNLLSQLTGYQVPNLQQIRPSRTLESKIGDSLCVLQKSYRFDARSGIGQLARAVNAGDSQKVDWVWNQNFSDIRFYGLSSDSYQKIITNSAAGYKHYLKALNEDIVLDIEDEELEKLQLERAKKVLQQFAKVRVLCAVREGDFGVEGLNSRIERTLQKSKQIQKFEEAWYQGRPIMVTQNDHGQSLYNGDIGITIFDAVAQKLKVYFELADGTVKGFLPSRIPQHETAYAMTIHKSQGSEFNTVHLVVPPEYMPLLTRELIYTGITRAKSQLALYADIKVFDRGVTTVTQRNSGLAQRLG